MNEPSLPNVISKLVIEAPHFDPTDQIQNWNVHPHLPKVPMFWGFIGPRHSGKSNLICNLLKQDPLWYGGFFQEDNVVIYSPTIEYDKTFERLPYKKYGTKTSVKALIDHCRNQQEEFMREKDHKGNSIVDELLMVFDDITPIPEAWRELVVLGYKGRHYHMHIFYVSHKMSSVTRGARLNTTQWCLFKPLEDSEFDWILACFAKKRSWPVWTVALQRCWGQEYNFAFIDTMQKDFHMRFRNGFHDPLFTPQEQQLIEGCDQDADEPFPDEPKSFPEAPTVYSDHGEKITFKRKRKDSPKRRKTTTTTTPSKRKRNH